MGTSRDEKLELVEIGRLGVLGDAWWRFDVEVEREDVEPVDGIRSGGPETRFPIPRPLKVPLVTRLDGWDLRDISRSERKSSNAARSVRRTGCKRCVNVVGGAGETSSPPGVVGDKFNASNSLFIWS